MESRSFVFGFPMLDRVAESTMLLEQLLRKIMNETDPAKYDELGEKICQVLQVLTVES